LSKVRAAVFQKSKKGNYTCGDSYFFQETEDGYICMIADGLGSGQMAKESSQLAIDVVKASPSAEPETIISDINSALVGKRGVVIGVLKLNYKEASYSFMSVGNIGLLAINDQHEKYRYISNAGYLAGYQRSFKLEHKALETDMNFIMFSDGVTERELSQDYMKNKSVEDIVTLYRHLSDEPRKDDTTLVALHYSTEA